MKHKLRKAEKTWRRTKLQIHREIYIKLKKERNALIQNTRNKHIKETLLSQKGNLNELYKTINSMIKQEVTPLPSYTCPKELANRFMDFFDDKISDIRSKLDSENSDIRSDDTPTQHFTSKLVPDDSDTCSDDTSLPKPTPRPDSEDLNTICTDGPRTMQNPTYPIDGKFDNFSPASEQEIETLIKHSPNKTCSLDPIPTWIIKKCHLIFVPIFTMIVNASLSTGNVPPNLKQAIITPLIKKPSLDHEILKNYRPVSNLSFLSKIAEKVVSKRIHTYLSNNFLFSKVQSAYRPNHSTETALIRVFHDIVKFLDKNNSVILVLLDLSAAFDTIDQQMLLKRLRDTFKFNGNVTKWFQSYLSDREQSVIINKTYISKTKILRYGVPQGSVLGPLLYTLYTKPLCDLISAFNIDHHMYADDTQLFFPFTKTNMTCAVKNAENCVRAIKNWMTKNKLKLNDEKTEIIQFNKNRSKNEDTIVREFQLPDTTITLSCNSIRNLGVFLDKELNMKDHVTKIIQSCNFMLRSISKIRHFLDEETTKMLVCSFIFSRLDYCNSLLIGIPNTIINNLQKVQNKAARLTSLTKKRDHITPVLKQLHWLPITKRIEYKILCNVFKCLDESAPPYLQELITRYHPTRNLRSANAILLDTPIKSSNFIQKSFGYSAPGLWNKLSFKTKSSNSFQSFKKNLKTELFNEYFK